MAMNGRTGRRDPLLDLWRGLALVDMAWVHFARYPIGMPPTLAAWIGDYTRFAAGAFVLLSGLTVSRVFAPALDAGGEAARAVTARLLRRALLLLVVDRLASLGFGAIERARLVPAGVAVHYPDVWHLLTFREAGATGGLLVLYAFLVAATPALHQVRRRMGDFALLAASFGAYALALAGGSVAHWPPWAFPIAFWQPLFVIGYVVGGRYEQIRSAPPRLRRAGLAAVTIAYAGIFVVRNGAALGIDSRLLPDLAFQKVPLLPAELAWYVIASAFVTAWSGWIFSLGGRVCRALEWACRLGRKSLLVYVVHLFLEGPVLEFLTLTDPSPLGRIWVLPVAALVMTAFAAAAERFQTWTPRMRANPFAMLRELVPAAGVVGGGAAAATFACVLLLQTCLPPLPAPPAGSTRDAALAGAGTAAPGEDPSAKQPAPAQRFTDLGLDDEPLPTDEPAPANGDRARGPACETRELA